MVALAASARTGAGPASVSQIGWKNVPVGEELPKTVAGAGPGRAAVLERRKPSDVRQMRHDSSSRAPAQADSIPLSPLSKNWVPRQFSTRLASRMVTA